MKSRRILFLISVFVLLAALGSVASCFSIASAEDTPPTSVNTQAVIASPDYMILNAPSVVAASDSYLVALDDTAFVVRGADGKTATLEPFVFSTIDQAAIVEDYLFVLINGDTATQKLIILDLITGRQLSDTISSVLNISDTASEYIYPFCLSPDKERGCIYALYYDGGVYRYDYTMGAEGLTLTKPQNNRLFRQTPTANFGYIKISYSPFSHKLYGLARYGVSYSVNEYSFDTEAVTTRAAVSISVDTTKVSLEAGETFFAVASGNKAELFAYDDTYTATVERAYDGFALCGDGIYLSDKAGKRIGQYTYSLERGQLQQEREYAHTGGGTLLLSAPTALTALNGKIIVCDSGNSRVATYSYEEDALSVSYATLPTYDGRNTVPRLVASSKNRIYVTDDADRLLCYNENGALLLTKRLPFTPSALACGGEGQLFLLSGNAVYTYDTEARLLYQGEDALTGLSVSGHANTLFAYNANTVVILSAAGERNTLLSIQTETEADIIALNADYKGNVFLLYRKGGKVYLAQYTREMQRYLLTATASLDCQYDTATLSGLVFDGDSMLTLNGKLCFPLRIATKEVFSAYLTGESGSVPQVPIVTPSVIAVTNKACQLFFDTDNYENYVQLENKQTAIVLFDYTIASKAVKYVLADGVIGYVLAENLTAVPDKTPPFDSAKILYMSVGVYSIPAEIDAYKLVSITDQKNVIEVLNEVGYVDEDVALGFVRVRYNGTEGYVMLKKLAKQTVTVRGTTEQDYVKINSKQRSVQVPLYVSNNTASTVILTLEDDTRLMLLEPFDEESQFTLVLYDNKQGYVETEYLLQRGLTDNQKSGVLLVMIVVVGAVILTLTLRAMSKR